MRRGDSLAARRLERSGVDLVRTDTSCSVRERTTARRVPGGGSRQHGLTLIELVVVVGLLGTLAALVAPRIGDSDATLAAQAHKLARDLRHAQALAMNRSRTLHFDVRSVTSYRVTLEGNTIDDPATSRPFAVTLDDGVTLSGIDTEIDGLGRPVAAGTPLQAERAFVLAGASRSVTVTMSPVTGFVTISP